MTVRAHIPATADTLSVTTARLQRACACGATAGVSGKCPDCAAEERFGVQPKLTVNPPGDRWEQEADRIAEQVVSGGRPQALRGPLSVTPLVQRQEAADAEEEEEEEPVQARGPVGHAAPRPPGPAFARDLAAEAGGGSPLDAATRAWFEPRFGRDLSGVRLHAGPRAAALSRAIDARAFTHANHVFFADGALDTRSAEGRRLLAHELTHTLQQGGEVRRSAVQRRGFFEQLAGLFRGDKIGEGELRAYLAHITTTNRIEDYTDSDNKARAVVNRLRDGDDLLGHQDTGALRALLIREMQSGFTGNDDERAIFFLLDTADEAQLQEMFTTGGLTLGSLDSDFHGAEQRQLDHFFEQRFEGGRTALERGEISPRPLRTPFEQMTVDIARRRLEFIEGLIAEAMSVELDKTRSAQERRDLDRTASDAATVLGRRGEQERAATERMNRRPLEVLVSANRIVFRVRFHVRFEDPAMRGRFAELATSLRTGIAQVWNQRMSGDTFGGRDFVMEPEIAEVDLNADRDLRFWLVTVRPADLGPANYPGCTIEQPVAGVPTSITDLDCDGGVISIPPLHIARPGILGHETLHLFGLIDRYMAMTDVSATGTVTGHTNVADRETGGRPDPLGAQEGTILEEDLAFVLGTQGVYEREIVRRTGGHGLPLLLAEADRLREIIRLGRDPNSLVQPRENFNRELFRSAEDL